MPIYKLPQCTIIEIHQMINIIWWIQYQRNEQQISKKTILSIDLYFLYEICLSEKDYFCKDTSIMTRNWSESMEDTDPPSIKLSSSGEMKDITCDHVCVFFLAHTTRDWQLFDVCIPLATRMYMQTTYEQQIATVSIKKANKFPKFLEEIYSFRTIFVSWA